MSRHSRLETAGQCSLLDMLAPMEPPEQPKLQHDAPKADAVKPKRATKQRMPVEPPVVIDEPQIPPEGAFAKINGRWHQWRGTESLSGSEFGWYLCKPYYSRAHLSDLPPRFDNSGKHQPKGWIVESGDGLTERTVTVAGIEFRCKAGEPDPELVEVRGIPCVIKWSWGFSTHAIDRDKPFWTHTGFFSFTGSHAGTTAEAVAEIEAMIDADGLEPWEPLFENDEALK